MNATKSTNATASETKAAVRVPELARRLSVSRAFAFRLVQTGVIRSVRAGRAVLVPVSAIDAFLENEEDPGR